MDDEMRPPRVTIRRQVEWAQTDAAGHHHWTAVLHWAEQAETALHERLGVAGQIWGREPRVHVSVDFTARLYFRDEVDIALWVERLGTTSATYAFTATKVATGEQAAAGTLVTAYVDLDSGRATGWPDALRAALSRGAAPAPPPGSGAADGSPPPDAPGR
ncbi:thioesterase family protein [Pseudonocardia sp. 73-21]|jgi:acyl-CoA thioesterase FadM|uniref:acyl-CoA thioesterase n=1 Tax=Pseudonocardia sp. 73-21 TaxID=1895809 RepID=UPI0009592027|nr:thioesterase family protein [Pseudonocardia sp. 73-21]OJY44137.1 MAG: hypothetical protein BGP03_07310 [Pseudonocardia sp. 73-21]